MVPTWLPTVAPLVVLAVVALVLLARFARQAGRRRQAAGWVPTPGVIVSSSVQVHRSAGRSRYVPVVVYQYAVNGRPVQGSRVRVGDELGRVQVAGGAHRIVARYPAGAQVTVYYDPANPVSAALER